MKKIVYVSGPHCSGKTTLLRKLAEDDSIILHKRKHSVKLEDTKLRIYWRLTKYYIEAHEQKEFSIQNPENIVMGDRCIYDNDVYISAFLELGWLSQKETEVYKKVFEAQFSEDILPRYIINLHPPLDWIIQNIKKRWETKEKKWREDNFNYLEKIVEGYDKLYSKPPCQTLRVYSTDLKERKKLILGWLNMM